MIKSSSYSHYLSYELIKGFENMDVVFEVKY